MKQAESDLVRHAAEGDRAAFAALVEEHWRALVGLARSVAGDGVAEDAVQDALVIAWKRLGSLRDHEAFPSWLRRVVVRQCLSRHRGWRRFVPLVVDGPSEPIFETDPGAEIDLQRCLKRLAPRQRAVMYLTVIEGRSDGDIASILQISAAGVRSHRRRARNSLSRFLDDHLPVRACEGTQE